MSPNQIASDIALHDKRVLLDQRVRRDHYRFRMFVLGVLCLSASLAVGVGLAWLLA